MRTPPPVLPPEDDSAPYKSTLFDRQGPDAAIRMRAIGFALPVFGLALIMWSMVVDRLWKYDGPFAGLLVFALAIATGAASAWLGLATAGGAGEIAGKIHSPSGSSTPYEDQFSYQEAMVARGDITSALESYEAVIVERPDAIVPRLRAAELYARADRDPRRAAALFREVRANPAVRVRDAVFASSRLADLYDGPLNEPGRALVELRRIIEQHPQSAVATHARHALPRLKARLGIVVDDGGSAAPDA